LIVLLVDCLISWLFNSYWCCWICKNKWNNERKVSFFCFVS